jgi:hypothetical protein
VTQIEVYTERVKRMVGKVLTGNGITRYDQGVYDLVGGEELSDAERDQLLQLCRQRIDAFREHRGEEVFAHRSRHRTPISGSIKVRVLTRAKGRCECCGAGCCSANPASTGPGSGPHRAEEHGRLGRLQQPAVPLLPLQRRQAMGDARRERIAERMIGAAGHVGNSMLGSDQRTNRDEILITNRSEAAA